MQNWDKDVASKAFVSYKQFERAQKWQYNFLHILIH